MRFPVVDEHATRADITETITHLRGCQVRACIPSTAREIAEEIGRLLDQLAVTHA